jgi:hypothetical protein
LAFGYTENLDVVTHYADHLSLIRGSTASEPVLDIHASDFFPYVDFLPHLRSRVVPQGDEGVILTGNAVEVGERVREEAASKFCLQQGEVTMVRALGRGLCKDCLVSLIAGELWLAWDAEGQVQEVPDEGETIVD